jgi:Flp pilus assembly protein CpaB
MQVAQRLLSTRGGTIAVAGFAALVAGVILIVYLGQYRNSVSSGSDEVPVLVATALIPKGTPGDIVGSQDLFQVNDIQKDHLKEGAVIDPAVLRGRVAAEDVFPGQQLTEADFVVAPENAVSSKLAEDERAISIPLDTAHGMIGALQPGDHVDVYAGFNVQRLDRNGDPVSDSTARPVMKLIMQDIYVLDAPTEGAGGGIGGGGGNAVRLRLTSKQAADLAFASDNGKVWLTVRPQGTAQPSEPDLVTLETLLLGVKPVAALRSFGGR